MPDVVQERRDLDVQRDARLELQAPRHPLRDMKRAERVAEARVLRAGIHEPRKAHLLDAPQPLHGERIEHVRDRSIGALELDEPVHRIAKHAVFHGRHPSSYEAPKWYLKPSRARKPTGLRARGVGYISLRMAAKTTRNCPSNFFSRSSSLRASSTLVSSSLRSCTKVRMMSMFT